MSLLKHELLDENKQLKLKIEQLSQSSENTVDNRCTDLFAHLPDGILIETQQRKILQVNQALCDLFDIQAEPAELKGMDCCKAAEQSSQLFADGGNFVTRIEQIMADGKPVKNEALKLKDGRVFERDYFKIKRQSGQTEDCWIYRDITNKKNYEERLKTREKWMRTLIETIPDPIWFKNPEGVYLSCNSRFEKFFGAKEIDIIGHTDYDFVETELADWFRKHDRIAMETGQPSINEETITYAEDGHTEIIETIKTPMYDSDNNLIGVLGIARDITERKKSEQALKESERRLSTLMSNLPGMVYRCKNDHAWTTEFVSRGCIKLTGYEPRDLIANAKIEYNQIIHPQDRQDVWNQIQSAIEKREPFQINYKIITKNKKIKLVSEKGVGLRDEEDNVIALEGFVTDITEQQEYQDKLKQSEAHLQALFDSTKQHFILFDRQMRVIKINQAAKNWIADSFSRTVNFGDSAQKIFKDTFSESFINSFKKVLAGEMVSYQKDLIINQKKVSFDLIFYPVKSPDGSVYGVSVSALDITERKRYEQDIQESERRLSTLMSNLPGMAYRCKNDANWTTEFVSKGCLELTGYSTEELMQPNTIKFTHPEDRQTVLENVQKSFKEERHFQQTYRLVTADNKIKWVFEKGVGIRDASGNVIAVEGFIKDITEQIEVQQKLNMIIRHSMNLFYSHTVDNQLTYVSPQSQELLDCTPEEAMRNWTEFLTDHPANQIGIGYTEKAIQTGQRQPMYELQLRTMKGRTIWVQVDESPVVQEGKTVSMVGSLYDVTDRKKIEDELNQSEKMFRGLFDSLGDAVFVTSVGENSGMILEANPAAVEQTGYSREELLGMNISRDLRVMGEREDILVEWDKEIQSGRRVMATEKKRKKDGTEYCTEMVATLIDYKGKPAALSINHDISNRMLLEEQLRQTQKMEAVGRLAGGVAHDFNNMLTVINGYGELLLLADIPEKIKRSVKEITNAGEKAARLTAQLLAFSRKQIIQPKIINLNEIISDHLRMLTRLLTEDIEVTTLLQPGLANIKADTGQIEQIILNITINARDAMPMGGKLTLQTSNVDSDREFIEQHPDAKKGKYVCLTIRDTGIGMDEKTVSRIFEPFFSTKGRDKGTGLGLATVYGIIKQNEGLIYVQSSLQKGTAFYIYLPAAKEELSKETERDKQTKLPKGDEVILLVEDDAGVQDLTRNALLKMGYTILTASNGDEALRVYKEHPGKIDLLLTDVIMPIMGGRELAERIRSQNPDLKIIYFSGYTDDNIVHHGVLEDGVNFIQKPFMIESLAKKIREVLDPEN